MEISRILNFDFILVLLFCPIVVAIVTFGSHCVAQCLSLGTQAYATKVSQTIELSMHSTTKILIEESTEGSIKLW